MQGHRVSKACEWSGYAANAYCPPVTATRPIAQTTRHMRWLLAVAGVLVVIIGLPLYFVPQNSNEYFSWTVNTDLSAAFLGGSYLAASVIELSAARESIWANARIAVPAVLVFTSLTLIVTLTNDSQYNYGASGFVQSAGTWAWTAVYLVVPPVMLLILWMQSRHGGSDPDRSLPVAPVLRGLIAAGGLALLVGGVILLLAPDASSWMWPWPVSNLTARSIGAWLVGFGVAMMQIFWEADWRRIQPATLGAGALGALQLVALLRHFDVPAWGSPQTWIYVGFMASFIALAVLGRRQTRNTD